MMLGEWLWDSLGVEYSENTLYTILKRINKNQQYIKVILFIELIYFHFSMLHIFSVLFTLNYTFLDCS